MAAVTLDAVSGASGVSKGGLLHHFPTKNALLDALFESLLERVRRRYRLSACVTIRCRMAASRRAYLRAVADLKDSPRRGRPLGAGDGRAARRADGFAQRWRDWVQTRAEEYVGTDSSVDAQIVRFAADGLWLADMLEQPRYRTARNAAALDCASRVDRHQIKIKQ